jgi:hypothetical protein
MTDEEYHNFLLIYPEDYIMHMTEEKYNKIKDLDYDNIIVETKYIETSYNSSLHTFVERELTEQEYENYVPQGYACNFGGGDGINLNDGTAYYESTAKKLTMVLLGGTTYNFVTLLATWKFIPATRSFDVIGFRGYDLSFRNGSQEGQQIYVLSDNSYHTINYSWNGTNIKKFSNGFGISMNIVNNNIKALQLLIECDVSVNGNGPTISGSYQHAVTSVSLANSQNYTLGVSGLGNVFVYPYNIASKYDGMSGIGLYYD